MAAIGDVGLRFANPTYEAISIKKAVVNMLLIQKLLAHVFIGLEANLTPENGLKSVKNS